MEEIPRRGGLKRCRLHFTEERSHRLKLRGRVHERRSRRSVLLHGVQRGYAPTRIQQGGTGTREPVDVERDHAHGDPGSLRLPQELVELPPCHTPVGNPSPQDGLMTQQPALSVLSAIVHSEDRRAPAILEAMVRGLLSFDPGTTVEDSADQV